MPDDGKQGADSQTSKNGLAAKALHAEEPGPVCHGSQPFRRPRCLDQHHAPYPAGWRRSEVIHMGHNRSVADVVSAAIQEDAQGIALSSYQGGHVEYFKYMVDSAERSRT